MTEAGASGNRGGRPPSHEPFESHLEQAGVERIAGLDEAGRGALFGPVVAAAAIVDPRSPPADVDDSKRLTPRQRRRCFDALTVGLADWAVGIASAREIDRVNILQATHRAMLRAIAALRRTPGYLLVDGNLRLATTIPQTAIVGGDNRCLSIAAASVIAKVARDTLIAAYARTVRGYGLARHKGYATAEHRRLLARRGLSPYHRRSFGAQGRLPFGAAPDEEVRG